MAGKVSVFNSRTDQDLTAEVKKRKSDLLFRNCDGTGSRGNFILHTDSNFVLKMNDITSCIYAHLQEPDLNLSPNWR